MENAYMRATLIQITNILLIFNMNPIMKCCQKSFNELVLLPNSDEWYHMWLVTKQNLDFVKMWKYPYKWNYSAIGLSKISNQLIWYHSSEFGSKTNSLKLFWQHFMIWFKVKISNMLVIWIKVALIYAFSIVF